eukprot:TRINITY_DN7433_c0_g1_i1.p1 TRINITY_DN7433_c0_g1~~TRINITY_DN7433_c0_g1_i1.p1  ORF type:complete len:238 (-),score=39.82 TRINITY_DN7433_c0_g1_i1:188-901(-)
MSKACGVLPGFFGLFLQGLLFALCVGTLVFKKYREGPIRTWCEFSLDSSKQFCGAGWMHTMNLVCAVVMGNTLQTGDQCEWYWINIMIDTTLGVYVQYFLLQKMMALLEVMLKESHWQEFNSGHYYNGEGIFQVRWYLKQLAVWLVNVTAMKAIMVAVMVVFATPLESIAHYLLGPFMENARLKLIVVMIVTPVCMNSLQFWVIDNFIKKNSLTACSKASVSPGENVGLLNEKGKDV